MWPTTRKTRSRSPPSSGWKLDGDAIVSVPIWTTTPWTLPASLAVSLGPDLDYVLVEGPAQKRQARAAGAGRGACDARPGALRHRHTGRARPHAKGIALDTLPLTHPFYPRDDSDACGRPCVGRGGHRRGAYGARSRQEDFVVAQAYGLIDTLSAAETQSGRWRGRYLPSTPAADGIELAGLHIWKANDAIVELLRARGVLLAFSRFEHSYPHCWRHKTPVAFRATPQWFISMEKAGLRDDALALNRIGREGGWFPDWGEVRIAGMIANRPGLVHLAPAHLGRADRLVRCTAKPVRRIRAAWSCCADCAARGKGWHRCLVRPSMRASCWVPRRIATRKSPTCSMSGLIPA
jgi:isoleucyl-tRNA synthetase